jgi:tyrosyl-tRNA synthetase
MGGSDQWGNIVAGVDLIRRVEQKSAFGITFPLITTSSGEKMGKTAKGAVWLDADRTSPYDYYQYWVNTDDRDVARFLALFTFLPMAEIRALDGVQGGELNAAKTVLAFEATQLAHGREEAVAALEAAKRLFGRREIPDALLPSSTVPRGRDEGEAAAVPTSTVSLARLEEGIPAFRLFLETGLASSGAAARRLIGQGGAYVNGERIDSAEQLITAAHLTADAALVLRSGKKKYHRVQAGK